MDSETVFKIELIANAINVFILLLFLLGVSTPAPFLIITAAILFACSIHQEHYFLAAIYLILAGLGGLP